MKLLLFVIILLSETCFGGYLAIDDARYFPESQLIEIDIRYSGGCEEHFFDFELGDCNETQPIQCLEAKIVDRNRSDMCVRTIFSTLFANRLELGLDDSKFDNSLIRVNGVDTYAEILLLKQ